MYWKGEIIFSLYNQTWFITRQRSRRLTEGQQYTLCELEQVIKIQNSLLLNNSLYAYCIRVCNLLTLIAVTCHVVHLHFRSKVFFIT